MWQIPLLFRPNESVKSIALLHDGALSWFKKKEKAIILTYTISEDTGTWSVSREGACMFGGCIKERWGEWKTLRNFQESVIQQNSLQAPERRLYQKISERQTHNSSFPHILTLACAQCPCFSPWVASLGVPTGLSPIELWAPNTMKSFIQAATLVSFVMPARSVRGNVFRKIILVSSIASYVIGQGLKKVKPMVQIQSVTTSVNTD